MSSSPLQNKRTKAWDNTGIDRKKKPKLLIDLTNSSTDHLFAADVPKEISLADRKAIAKASTADKCCSDIYSHIASFCSIESLTKLRAVNKDSLQGVNAEMQTYRIPKLVLSYDATKPILFSHGTSTGSILLCKGWTSRYATRDEFLVAVSYTDAKDNGGEDGTATLQQRSVQLIKARMENNGNGEGWADSEDFLKPEEIDDAAGDGSTKELDEEEEEEDDDDDDDDWLEVWSGKKSNSKKVDWNSDESEEEESFNGEEESDDDDDDEVSLVDDDEIDGEEEVDLDDDGHFVERCKLLGNRLEHVTNESTGWSMDVVYGDLSRIEGANKSRVMFGKALAGFTNNNGCVSKGKKAQEIQQMKILFHHLLRHSSIVKFGHSHTHYRSESLLVDIWVLLLQDETSGQKYELVCTQDHDIF
jgi:hypothetical protein